MIASQEHPPRVVAVPAKDEAERIAACLDALDCQTGAQFSDIVLFVNNSRDATAALARGQVFRAGTVLHVIERELAPGQANAGFARRAAMEIAAEIAGEGGVLFTTDADAVVDPDWLVANLAAFQAGADAVAGWVELDPIDWAHIPTRLHEDDAWECAYDALCDEIHALLDPDPIDPWPRHTQHSGASIALTARAYARCGGVPAVACGEDRLLMAALRRVDAKIRHAPEVHVTVSGRIDGRSRGGMADTIKRRLVAPDAELDDRLEPATLCALRAQSRAWAARAYRDPDADIAELSALLGLADWDVRQALTAPHFGEAWDALSEIAPALVRRRVPVSELAMEMEAARRIIADIRAAGRKVGALPRTPPGTMSLDPIYQGE